MELKNGCKLYTAEKETVEAYWKWICGLPKRNNPFLNNDGRRDGAQEANRWKVFYLSPADSGPYDRTCNVPWAKFDKVLIPSLCVVATGVGKGGEKPGKKLEDLIRYNEVDQDPKNIEYRRVKIDEELIPEEFLKKCRYGSRDEGFPVTFPEDHPMFNASPGLCTAVADGVYLILDCTSVSDKTRPQSEIRIHLEGKINLPDEEESLETTNYTEGVNYTLRPAK